MTARSRVEKWERRKCQTSCATVGKLFNPSAPDLYKVVPKSNCLCSYPLHYCVATNLMHYPFVHRRDRVERILGSLPDLLLLLTAPCKSLLWALVSHAQPGWGLMPLAALLTVGLILRCKKEHRSQGLPGRTMLPPGTKLLCTSLELEGHRFGEVARLSELKENPAWLFVILPELWS